MFCFFPLDRHRQKGIIKLAFGWGSKGNEEEREGYERKNTSIGSILLT